MPSTPSILGFLFGLAVVVVSVAFDLPPIVGGVLIALIFGGWLVTAVIDRRPGSGA
jgi:hypothetical protein